MATLINPSNYNKIRTAAAVNQETPPPVDQARLEVILEHALTGERIDFDEAVYLYRYADLLTLGHIANRLREQRTDASQVTYLVDRNINYTNVCITNCQFCAFYRPPGHEESYTQSYEQIGVRIKETLALGGTRILMQGGHNPDLPIEWYEGLLSYIKETCPIEIDGFSPSEIDHIATISNLSTLEVLRRFKEKGLDGLPGGGAEILVDEIRQRVSPLKLKSDGWLRIEGEAQSLGLVTSATNVFGFSETLEQRVMHFARLRELQDTSLAAYNNGFSSFIAWPAQKENTSLGKSKLAPEIGATPQEYLRHQAIARIFLDNIPHHQASWPTMGAKTAQVALKFGADDFGSTMIEENVVSQAGGASQRSILNEKEIQRQIKAAGYSPAKRNSKYNILQRFD